MSTTIPPPPPALQLACPDNLSVQSTTGQPIPISYPPATATGGTPPTQVVCSPATGSVFAPGTTPVQCVATDSKNVGASCAFTVTVTLPPRLAATKFVAFGDSMTAGQVISEGAGLIIRTLQLDDAKAYPTLLLSMLQGRYTGQAGGLVMFKAGVPGETTAGGVGRLPTIIDGGTYDVLLLMEGANDFPNYQAALGNMRTMIEYAKRRNLRVYVATVPPENPTPDPLCYANLGGNFASVDPYNSSLRALIGSEGVTLVDVGAAFNGDLSLVDCDGLHPTPAGYQLIASTFFKAIEATLELPATPTATSTPFRTAAARARRSR